MTEDRIEKLRELARKSGKWEYGGMIGDPGKPLRYFIAINRVPRLFSDKFAVDYSRLYEPLKLADEAVNAIPFLLSLYDSQQQRIEELEVSVKALDEYWMPTAKNEERLRLLAEARVSRAEQALTIKADEAERLFEERRQLLEALSTERERVIQECAAACDAEVERCRNRQDSEGRDGNGAAQSGWAMATTTALILAAAIRALSSLPTPPQQTQKWIPVK